MPAAVPAAVAGAQLIMGAKGAHDAKEAAKAQTASADRALGLETQIYRDNVARMQPFVTGGQSAFQTLLNGWQAKQPNFSAPVGAPSSATPFAQAMGANAGNVGQMSMVNAGPMARPGVDIPINQRSGYEAPAPMNTGGYGSVRVQAPDGEVRDLPASLADRAIAAGARRLN